MKIKNDVVFNKDFAKSFSNLLKLAFSASISLQLVQTYKALDEQQKNVFTVRDALLDRLGKRDEKENYIFTSPDTEKQFYEEMDNLMKLEFEIPLKEKLKLDDKIQISGEDILILLPVLDVNI